MLLWIWVTSCIVAVTLYLRQVYSRFSNYGVKHPMVIPFFGSFGKVLLRIEHIADNLTNLYKNNPNERFVGRYEFLKPVVVIRDLELAKKITVKDFEYFLDHRVLMDDQVDPLFGRNLFSLKGQEWKEMRSTLSPAFTSSKIRVMVPFMVEVGDQMDRAIQKQIAESKDGYVDIDTKDLSTRYANDVIASCAFGLKVDSHNVRDNDFYANGKIATNFSFLQLIKFMLMLNFPKICNALKVNLFAESVQQFFRHLVKSTMDEREKQNIIRPDMIHLLMEAKKGRLIHEEKAGVDSAAGFATVEESTVGKKEIDRVWSDDDLTAQAILFFLAGFETVSSSMTFLLHELAVNPDVQDRLVKEIRENDAKNNGKFDYNSIQNMVYMDMVVSEVLRLWPPAVGLDRVCVKDYNLGRANDTAKEDYVIRKGEGVMIPTWAFHRDPEYFPDPEKFDPERFSEENKHNIKPFSYSPFGLGPRNCIGSRFALCEVKVMVYQLLRNMELSPAAKTRIPAKLSTESFNLRMKGGHWVRFKLRK